MSSIETVLGQARATQALGYCVPHRGKPTKHCQRSPDAEKLGAMMPSCEFFVKTRQEEHKKHPDVSVSFLGVSKKYSERWMTHLQKKGGNLKAWKSLTRLLMKEK